MARDPRQGEMYFWPEVSENHPMGEADHRWVVISSDRFNTHSQHVLACPVTSYPATALDIAVRPTPHNGLRHDSSVLPRMITPILKSELGTPCGRLGFDIVKQTVPRLQMIVEAR